MTDLYHKNKSNKEQSSNDLESIKEFVKEIMKDKHVINKSDKLKDIVKNGVISTTNNLKDALYSSDVTLKTKDMQTSSKLEKLKQYASLISSILNKKINTDHSIERLIMYFLIHYSTLIDVSDLEVIKYYNQNNLKEVTNVTNRLLDVIVQFCSKKLSIYNKESSIYNKQSIYHKEYSMYNRKFIIDSRWLPDSMFNPYAQNITSANNLIASLYYLSRKIIFEPNSDLTKPKGIKYFSLLQYIEAVKHKQFDMKVDDTVLKESCRLLECYDKYLTILFQNGFNKLSNEQVIDVIACMEWRFIFYKYLKEYKVDLKSNDFDETLSNLHVHFKWFFKNAVRKLNKVIIKDAETNGNEGKIMEVEMVDNEDKIKVSDEKISASDEKIKVLDSKNKITEIEILENENKLLEAHNQILENENEILQIENQILLRQNDVFNVCCQISQELTNEFSVLRKISKRFLKNDHIPQPLVDVNQLTLIPEVKSIMSQYDVYNKAINLEKVLNLLNNGEIKSALLEIAQIDSSEEVLMDKIKLIRGFESDQQNNHRQSITQHSNTQLSNIQQSTIQQGNSEQTNLSSLQVKLLTLEDYFYLIQTYCKPNNNSNQLMYILPNISSFKHGLTVPPALATAILKYNFSKDECLKHELLSELFYYKNNAACVFPNRFLNYGDDSENEVAEVCLSLQNPVLSNLILDLIISKQAGKQIVAVSQFGRYREAQAFHRKISAMLWRNFKQLSEKEYDFV